MVERFGNAEPLAKAREPVGKRVRVVRRDPFGVMRHGDFRAVARTLYGTFGRALQGGDFLGVQHRYPEKSAAALRCWACSAKLAGSGSGLSGSE